MDKEKEKQQRELHGVGDSSLGGQVDDGKAKQALSQMSADGANESAQAKIKVRAEDINLIVAELEVSRKVAEAALVSSGGDVVGALTTLVQ